jgi:hypothetical protein
MPRLSSEQFARTTTPAAENMDRMALRDHARAILLAAARDMTTAQNASEQHHGGDGRRFAGTGAHSLG